MHFINSTSIVIRWKVERLIVINDLGLYSMTPSLYQSVHTSTGPFLSIAVEGLATDERLPTGR